MQPIGAAAFNVSGDAYDRFMGRYSRPLAVEFATFADIDEAALRVLDVGCGPGALTAELVRRVGASSVLAGDPSPSFVAACAARKPRANHSARTPCVFLSEAHARAPHFD